MKRGRIGRRVKNQDCHGLLMGSKEADILQDYSQCWIENILSLNSIRWWLNISLEIVFSFVSEHRLKMNVQ